MASLSQGRTAAAQCGLFTHKSVPVIFEPPCSLKKKGSKFWTMISRTKTVYKGGNLVLTVYLRCAKLHDQLGDQQFLKDSYVVSTWNTSDSCTFSSCYRHSCRIALQYHEAPDLWATLKRGVSNQATNFLLAPVDCLQSCTAYCNRKHKPNVFII